MKLYIKIMDTRIRHTRFVSTDKIDVSFDLLNQQHFFAMGHINLLLLPNAGKSFNEYNFFIINDSKGVNQYNQLCQCFKEGKDIEICFKDETDRLVLSGVN